MFLPLPSKNQVKLKSKQTKHLDWKVRVLLIHQQKLCQEDKFLVEVQQNRVVKSVSRIHLVGQQYNPIKHNPS